MVTVLIYTQSKLEQLLKMAGKKILKVAKRHKAMDGHAVK